MKMNFGRGEPWKSLDGLEETEGRHAAKKKLNRKSDGRDYIKKRRGEMRDKREEIEKTTISFVKSRRLNTPLERWIISRLF